MNDSYEEYRLRVEAYERGQVAALNCPELLEQWDALRAAEKAVREAKMGEKLARTRYTEILAKVKNFKVGDRVQRQESHGYGSTAKLRTATYEIVGFASSGYGDGLRLLVNTVRKDGSIGQRREIGGDVTKIDAEVQS